MAAAESRGGAEDRSRLPDAYSAERPHSGVSHRRVLEALPARGCRRAGLYPETGSRDRRVRKQAADQRQHIIRRSMTMTPEQGTFLQQLALQSLERESATTRKVLEAVPSDKADYRPDPVAMSAFELCWHIAAAENM